MFSDMLVNLPIKPKVIYNYDNNDTSKWFHSVDFQVTYKTLKIYISNYKCSS